MTPEPSQIEQIMTMAPVIPVITIDDVDAAIPMAEALVRGGLQALEVTLRTPDALEAIRRIADAVPRAVPGAGTIMKPDQFADVLEAGARFTVSPGVTEDLLNAAADTPLPYLPGAATASEVMRLAERGIKHQKFFPAETAGGIAALKALSAPLAEIRFCPTGGVGPANVLDYLALPNVLCVGGSWVVPPDAIAMRDWPRLEQLASEAARLRSAAGWQPSA